MAGFSFSGIASGIDSAALIESLIGRERSLKIAPLEQRRTTLSEQNEVFAELVKRLTTLKQAASNFSTISGAGVDYGATSSDETVLTGAASKSAVQGSYAITTTQLAKNATVSLFSEGTTYHSTSEALSSGSAFSDTVSIVIGDSGSPLDTVTVNVNETTTLDGFVSQFNEQTSDAVASIINVGTEKITDYRIVITSKNTGLDKGALAITVGSTLSGRDALDKSEISNATNAVFSIAGVGTGIERGSNNVSDIIQGVTFSLKGLGSSTLAVSVNATATTSSLKSFVKAYNDVIEYVAENDAVTRNESGGKVTNIFGALATTSLDENLLSSLRGALTGASSSGGAVNVFPDLGVTSKRDGTLAFDETVFKSALAADPNGASRVLNKIGDNLSLTNGTIDQYTGFGRLIDFAKTTNTNESSRLDQRISTYEKSIAQREQALITKFAGLERLMAKLQNAQSTLSRLFG